MSGAGHTDRAERRHVRLRLVLRSGRQEVSGYTANLSASGLYAQVAEGATDAFELGARLGLRLPLPGAAPVEATVEVVWARRDDRDSAGRPMLGLGLRLIEVTPADRERLDAFVGSFRYCVVCADQDPDHEEAYRALEPELRLIRVRTEAQALSALESNEVSVLILGEQLGERDSIAFLDLLSSKLPRCRASRLMASEYTVAGQLQLLVNEGQLFAYLRKPFSAAHLSQVVRRAVDAYALLVENERLHAELERANAKLARDNDHLRRRLVGAEGSERIIGSSAELKQVIDALMRVRRTDANVHLMGETGTGKELVARAIHQGGPRSNGHFVAQNCGGMSPSLLQSTLFGHRRGAFTGADKDHDGVFRRAHEGTLLLDEVSELGMVEQSAFLRVLQEGEVVPLGATKPVKVDVRIISATHKDLREEVRAGRFREDLYFRLVVVAIRLPALRERKGDIPLLAVHFLDLHCELKGKEVRGFSDEAMRALERYAWPGNVRELENEVERLVVLCEEGRRIPPELLSPHIRGASEQAQEPCEDCYRVDGSLGYDQAIESLERSMVRDAMERGGGVVARAAELIGMERSRLTKLRQRLGLA
ncbi:MAG: sigma 54-interacting transcriptional regulator [Myxococcales bacterium]|nr:sigma 54-interacting transcriptional regulator [Myxococcales bacterium]